jgi:hypothetical protein
MAVAMIRPEPEKLKRRGSSKVEVHQGCLSEARAVLAYSPKLAEAVMRGDKPLKAALAEARQGQGSPAHDRSRLAKLQDERPDLAELVTSEALSLDEAIAKAKAEAEESNQRRWAATMSIIDGLRPFDHAPETAGDEIAS